jgi:hypothetical protein
MMVYTNDAENSNANSIYAFTKRVKEGAVAHRKITDAEDILKIGEVIQRLEELPKASILRIDELRLRANVKEWVNSLLREYLDKANEKEMGYLVSDFTDAMQTRMREESKYAVGLLMPNKLILSHSSFGEETITPEWKTIPRMLDRDNVLRYVCFINGNGVISVRYWEREASSSFIEWLGLPRKAAFLFGGKYRIRCEIEDITTEFQLTEQEMERWLESHSEFRGGTIKFSSPVQLLSITEIMAGRRRYENPEDFIQDYEAEKLGMPHYMREYERINNKLLPILMKYYDEKTQLVMREGEDETVEVAKAEPSFDILFVNEHIDLRASYLNDIIKRFINGEQIKIVHAGIKFKAHPYVIGSMEIYNEILSDSLIQIIVDKYNNTNLQDTNLDLLLRYAIFKRLAEVNSELPVTHFFEQVSQGIMNLVSLKGKWTKLEDTVLEYKSADIFVGGNEEIIEKLSEDLKNKLKESPCKVYFIGVEDDGTIQPIPSSRLKSDRVATIRDCLKERLGIDNIYTCPVMQEQGSILLIMAFRK